MAAPSTQLLLPRPFPGLNRDVSILGLGAGPLGDATLEDRDAERLVRGALELGLNLIDTAPSYGRSEERLGRFLGGAREAVILTTKCGYGVPGVEDWTPACITLGVEAALRRLRTDYLDAVYLHSCSREVLERPGVLEALEQCVAGGKVRLAGYSGENDALAFAAASGRFGVLQRSVNLCDQGVFLAPPFEGAVLAKRSLANAAWDYAQRPAAPDVATYWDRLMALALDPQGMDGAEFALRFTAFATGVTASLVGTRSLERLRGLCATVTRGALSADVLGRIRTAYLARGAGWPGVI